MQPGVRRCGGLSLGRALSVRFRRLSLDTFPFRNRPCSCFLCGCGLGFDALLICKYASRCLCRHRSYRLDAFLFCEHASGCLCRHCGYGRDFIIDRNLPLPPGKPAQDCNDDHERGNGAK